MQVSFEFSLDAEPSVIQHFPLPSYNTAWQWEPVEVDYCCSRWFKVNFSIWMVHALYFFKMIFLIVDDLWSCKVEIDNDRLKGEVLPKRGNLVKSERRLSEKTNDLKEVNTLISFLFQMDQEGDVSLLIYCFCLSWIVFHRQQNTVKQTT